MNKTALIFNVINCIVSPFLWLLGLLTLLFNLLGQWELWHLAGFAFVFYLFTAITVEILSIVFALISKRKKFIITGFLFVAISTVISLFTALFSSTWLW